MLRFLGWLLLSWLCIWLLGTAPVQAAPCSLVQGQQICIVSIQRSAKYYWQYWLTLTMNGQASTKATVDCRYQRIYRADGRSMSFQDDLLGNTMGPLVCRAYHGPVVGRS